MKRVPIIKRIPIISTGLIFQTIASNDEHYENSKVMGTYPTLEIARLHYKDDMKEYRLKGYANYAIRSIKEKQEDN